MIIKYYRGFTIRQTDTRGYFATSTFWEDEFSDYTELSDLIEAIDQFLDWVPA